MDHLIISIIKTAGNKRMG